ncbi:hypothetical protein A6J88_06710 [Neisseria mucosa]|uniref:Uncharacterized protein n=3 Tax=Neisseria TaxID=482 RepID=A0ABM6JBX3_NEIMU|nr:hypothetical protein A6J88_06710 [Neisseria mucosa]
MRFGTSCKYGNTLGLQQSSETQFSPFQTTSIVPSNHKRQIYSGLTLNQYGVTSPCRTICTVCGFVALS